MQLMKADWRQSEVTRHEHVNGGCQVIDNCFDVQVHFFCSALLAKVDITHMTPHFHSHVTVQSMGNAYAFL